MHQAAKCCRVDLELTTVSTTGTTVSSCAPHLRLEQLSVYHATRSPVLVELSGENSSYFNDASFYILFMMLLLRNHLWDRRLQQVNSLFTKYVLFIKYYQSNQRVVFFAYFFYMDEARSLTLSETVP